MSTTMMTWDYDRLLPTTESILLRSGWSPNRRVTTATYRKANKEIGLTFSLDAEAFLANMGGLNLEYPHFANPSALSGCSFNPVRACDAANIDQIRLYERHVRQSLCVIGDEEGGYLTLMMTPEGNVFAGYEYDLITVGETPATALNNLCSGKCLPVITVPRVLEQVDHSPTGLTAEVIREFIVAGRDVQTHMPSAAGSAAELFGRRYGGVSIACKGADGTPDTCRLFSPLSDKHWECTNETIAVIGSPADPIGEIIGARIHLVMSNDGRVFGFLPEIASALWCYGSSGEEALNNIVLGKGGTRV